MKWAQTGGAGALPLPGVWGGAPMSLHVVRGTYAGRCPAPARGSAPGPVTAQLRCTGGNSNLSVRNKKRRVRFCSSLFCIILVPMKWAQTGGAGALPLPGVWGGAPISYPTFTSPAPEGRTRLDRSSRCRWRRRSSSGGVRRRDRRCCSAGRSPTERLPSPGW